MTLILFGRLYLRLTLKRLVLVAALGGSFLLGASAFKPSSPECPSGKVFNDSSLIVTCDSPDGSIACVINATGFSRDPVGNPPGVSYAAHPPGAPWCPLK